MNDDKETVEQSCPKRLGNDLLHSWCYQCRKKKKCIFKGRATTEISETVPNTYIVNPSKDVVNEVLPEEDYSLGVSSPNDEHSNTSLNVKSISNSTLTALELRKEQNVNQEEEITYNEQDTSDLNSDKVQTNDRQRQPRPPPAGCQLRRVFKRVKCPGDLSDVGEDSGTSKSQKPEKIYMTKKRKIAHKIYKLNKRESLFARAKREFEKGKFKSLHQCGKHFNIPYSSLHRFIMHGEMRRVGRPLMALTELEEKKVSEHCVWRAQRGCGSTRQQLQILIQEILQEIVTVNPNRVTGYEKSNQLPPIDMVQRLITRRGLSVRKTIEISRGRQACTEADLDAWFNLTLSFFTSKPELNEAYQDPTRVFNQVIKFICINKFFKF